MDELTYRQAIVDEEHLRLLPVSYWLLGATSALTALGGLAYVGLGALFAFLPWDETASPSEAPPAALGWFFMALGLSFILAFAAVATLQVLTGFWIRSRKHRVFSLVIAGITCLNVPFGTLFGVFTFTTLLRPSVAALFDRPETPVNMPAAPPPDAGEQVVT